MDHNKKQGRDQSNDHRSLDGIIRIPQSLGYQSRHNILGDTTRGIPLVDLEISRNTTGDKMKIPQTKEQVAGRIAYAAGYLLAMATLVKFGWWVWQQPW
jgi:hypothetical protein